MAGMECMREFVSRQYSGKWRERVRKMPDCQVAAIYHNMQKELEKAMKGPKNPKLTETEVRGGEQLCLFEKGRSKKIKEEYLNG